ncbi:hypothetical protein OIU76_000016 [Salix suchowensis]|nr:hypothetical protein OIU76_000016 [Salix suchowensis]
MEGNLNRFQVGQLPTVIYMPNFITQTEETHLLQKVIYEAPLSKWKSLKNRRLQNWGGVVPRKRTSTPRLASLVNEDYTKNIRRIRAFPLSNQSRSHQ